MTPFTFTLSILNETNARAAATLRAAGPSADGDPIPGLFGWMPTEPLRDLASAIIISHHLKRTPDFPWSLGETEKLVDWIRSEGTWRRAIHLPNTLMGDAIANARREWYGWLCENVPEVDPPAAVAS